MSAPTLEALTASEAISRFWRLPELPPLPRRREWVYFLESQSVPCLVKIGKAQSLRWRILTAQYMSPAPLKLVGAVNAPAGTERIIHAKFKALRHHGWWFAADDSMREFIAELPKAGLLPAGMAETWSSQTGIALMPERRRRRGPKARGSNSVSYTHL